MEFASRPSRGFSLVELAIVVVIVGLLAAIAIPRFSRGTSGAGETATLADLAALRKAIEHYAAEHNGSYPSGMNVTNALTLYSNAAGGTSATRSDSYTYGPYLLAIPALKTGTHAGGTTIAAVNSRPTITLTGSPTQPIGWLYYPATGQIWPNDTDLLDR